VSWRRFFERRRRDEEFARELEAHLALEIDELIARGVPRDEARARAARKLGNRTSLRELAYEHNSVLSLEAFLRDLRYGLRQLRRNPLFTTVAVLSLALGIGANAAMFSVLDQALFRMLPVERPQELVLLFQPGQMQGWTETDEPGGPSFSPPTFRGLQANPGPFTGIAGARSVPASLAYDGQASFGTARRVSGNYFDLLGVRPAAGRLFTTRDDETPGAHPVVVLSHAYWMRRFGGEGSIVNRPLVVNGVAMTVVGVGPRGFTGERRNESADVFVPLSMNAAMAPEVRRLDDRRHHWIALFARLKPGMTRERAQVEIEPSYRAEIENDLAAVRLRPDTKERYAAKRLVLQSGAHGRGGPNADERTQLLLVMGMTVLVLLIACANLASLQLGRAAARWRETTVRVALGASRAVLVRQLLVESCLVGLIGGALGLMLARWTLPALAARIPGAPGDTLSVVLDTRVLSFGFLLSLTTGILFGLFPALQASRPGLADALKDQSDRASATPGATWFRLSIVTGQIALSLLLLVGAGLFTRTFLNLIHIDLGQRVAGLVTFSVQPKLNRYDDTRAAELYRQLRERLSAHPAVRNVSDAMNPAIAGNAASCNVTVPGFVPADEADADSRRNAVAPGYFRTLGIPLIAGRDFTADDAAGAPKVAIVNETFVRHFLGTRDALGTRFGLGAGSKVPLDIEIVGVAKDAHYDSVDEPPPPVFHLPLAQAEMGGRHFYIHTDAPPETMAALVRSEVAALDRDLPVRGFKSMRTQIDERLFQPRAMTTLTMTFAGLATLLAGLGLYGVLAYNVARRTREIGIRIALGAGAREVRRLLGREVAWLLTIGGVLGLAGGAALGRVVQTMLYEVRPWDPAVYASALSVLAMMAVAAVLLPARRATRINPVIALRHD